MINSVKRSKKIFEILRKKKENSPKNKSNIINEKEWQKENSFHIIKNNTDDNCNKVKQDI